MPSGSSENLLTIPPGEADNPLGRDEQFRLQAFGSFTEAVSSLEQSYSRLRAEVTGLGHELQESNSELTRSLGENRRLRELLDRIFEELPCGVLVVDGMGQIERASPQARRLLAIEDGCPADQLGSLVSIGDEMRQLLERARHRAGEHEGRMAADDSTGKWVAVRHATVPDAGSSIFILRDVSDRKRLEEAREKLRREQTLAETTAILAHEIRNPLGSLELFAGLLAEADLTSDCRRWVEQVQSGLRMLAATVNNVLHFHSLPRPELAPVDLGHLLDWAQSFFTPLARRARVEIVLRNHLTGVCVPADRHRLEQVLSNLVLNALRAMPGGGWIKIAGRVQENSTISIAVTDTGPGIAPEHLPDIFQAGFSTRAGSPGLGLAVCRKIVEQHGGTIQVASRRGNGAAFTITFPVSERAAEATA